MSKLKLALVACAAVTIAGCGGNKANNATANASATTNGSAAATGAIPGNASAGGAGTAAWPEGSRIVVENGVTYRVDAGGARVQLGPNDSRVVTEKGVSYRVDPGGTRVRLDSRGGAVRIGDSVIKGNAPNGRSDVETPGEAATDALEDGAEAIGDAIPD